MKGKNVFTRAEYDAIVGLLKDKVKASDKSVKKLIRSKLRKIGLFSSDFQNNSDEFDVDDFLRLVKSGIITIIEEHGDGWHISEVNKSLSPERKSGKTDDQKTLSMDNCVCLDAYVPKDPRILVLGTMPGQQSLRLHQYYANPANRFWKIIAEAAGKPLPTVYSDRLKLLDQLHVALWDVYASAERKGSLDSKIANKKRNDIQSLVKANPSINKILFNGNKAYEESLDYGCVNVAMPSTSPANTHLTQEELFSKWLREIKEY